MDWTDRVGRRLSPRDLHVFLAVAEEGSMAKAADRLAVSRPVVSKSIAAMEATLGVRLLDRAPSGIELTAYGEALLRRGRAVFDELRQGVEEIATLADPNAGLLRVGTSEVHASGLVAATIARLSARYPRLRFLTERGGVHMRLDLLRERRVDVFVTRPLVTEIESDMTHVELGHERPIVVCGVAHALTRRRRLALAELLDQAWILAPAEIAPGGPVAEAFRAAGLSLPERILVSDSLTLRHSLLATGRFLTVIPHMTLRLAPLIPWLRELPVAIPPWHLPTVVALLRHRAPTPAAQLFVAEAQAVAGDVARLTSAILPPGRQSRAEPRAP